MTDIDVSLVKSWWILSLGNVRFRDSVGGGDRSTKPERYRYRNRYRYRWIPLHPVRSIPIPIPIPIANALS